MYNVHMNSLFSYTLYITQHAVRSTKLNLMGYLSCGSDIDHRLNNTRKLKSMHGTRTLISKVIIIKIINALSHVLNSIPEVATTYLCLIDSRSLVQAFFFLQ